MRQHYQAIIQRLLLLQTKQNGKATTATATRRLPSAHTQFLVCPTATTQSARHLSTTAASSSSSTAAPNNNNNTDTNNQTNNKASSSSSVSSDEVKKFSGMDERWWDPKFHPLIAMNPVRIRYILDTIQKEHPATTSTSTTNTSTTITKAPPFPLKDLKALDVGCGGGLLSESLARLGANVTAIDPSQALVDMAKRHAQIARDPRLQAIDYRGGTSVEELASSSSSAAATIEKYDVVCLLEVLEHATDVKSLVQAASSLVKEDGGVLFVSTMNKTWKSHLLTIVGAEYIMGYVPVGTHNWNQYLSPEEVARVMRECGLEPINVSGMVLSRPPFCGNWDWKIDPMDTDVNWIGAYRKKRS